MPQTSEDLEIRISQANSVEDKVDALLDLSKIILHTDIKKFIELSENALQLATTGQYTTNPYQKGRLCSLQNLCKGYSMIGEYDRAIPMALEVLTVIDDESEYQDIRGFVQLSLGYCHFRLGDYSAALDSIFKAHEIAIKIDHEDLHSQALDFSAMVYAMTGEFSQAISYHEKSLKLCTSNPSWQAFCLNNLAVDYIQIKEFETALSFALKSLQIGLESDIKRVMPHVLDTLGQIYAHLGDFSKAVDHYEQAISSAQDTGIKVAEVDALFNLGESYSLNGEQDDLALVHLHRGLALAEEMDTKPQQFNFHRALANVYERQSDFEQALAHHKQFAAIEKEVFNENADMKVKTLQVLHETETALKETEIYRLKNVELQEALDNIKQLSGLLPICAWCKKIRDDTGYWHQLEQYFDEHTETQFSHGICPECVQKMYPEEKPK
jgi:tetratricopeptide (TPR) repeat protein